MILNPWFDDQVAKEKPKSLYNPYSDPELHDFNDGKGPVKAVRHKNSNGNVGGWVADTAIVYPGATIDRNSEVFGWATIGSGVYIGKNVRIYDFAHINDDAIILNHLNGKIEIFGESVLHSKDIINSTNETLYFKS